MPVARDPLEALRDRGCSLWYSYFRASLTEAGFFRALVRDGTIRGAVLDPVTFARLLDGDAGVPSRDAVGSRSSVNDRLLEELRHGTELFERLHLASGAADGFVAVELSPDVSRRPDESLARARRLRHAVERPNVMLRVPGTPDRAETVEALVADGVSVSVTCLYGAEQAVAALRAVERGLAARIQGGGEPTRARALLCVHLRRIDLVVDEMLGDRIRDSALGSDLAEGLLSQVGIAVARSIAAAVEETLAGREWRRLRQAGAPAPRLCWEGTTVSDPRERASRYVDAMASRDTVVVLAPTTIAALRSRGPLEEPRFAAPDAAAGLLDDLRVLGIDMDEVADDLQGQEVEHRAAVSRALGELAGQQAAERRRPVGAAPDLDAVAEGMATQTARLAALRVPERLWLGDGPRPEPPSRRGPHAWIHVVEALREEALAMARFARRLRGGDRQRVLLIGAGGDSLAVQACADAFERASFLILGSTAPGAVRRVERTVDPAADLLLVTCKSAALPEIEALAAYFEGRWEAAGGSGERRLVITDPGTPLHARAVGRDGGHVWLDSPEIDARYGALSRVGLLPMALMDVDVGALLARAHAMALRCAPEVDPVSSPGLVLAAFLSAAHAAGRDKVTFLASGRLASLPAWAGRLLAGVSLATGRRGPTPIVDEPPGSAADYASDRAFVQIRMADEEDPDQDALARELRAAGHPVASLRPADLPDLGAELFRWQLAAAALEMLAAPVVPDQRGAGAAGMPPDGPSQNPDWRDRLAAGLRGLEPPGHLAIHAHLTPTVRVRTALASLRERVREQLRVATTLSWGPDATAVAVAPPRPGLSLILLAREAGDRTPPGGSRSLGDLARERARREWAELRARGRPVVAVDLGERPGAAAEGLVAAAAAALGRPASR